MHALEGKKEKAKSKRVGGANYQVPREVRPERKFFLACNWIIGAARAKVGVGNPACVLFAVAHGGVRLTARENT